MKVRHVASADLEMPTDNARPPLWVRLGARKLESNWGLDVIGGSRIAGDSADQLAVRIGDGSALLFDAAAVANPWHLVLAPTRSEEHTSELPSLMRTSYAVFCLKKTN